jgi:hypothetical protein
MARVHYKIVSLLDVDQLLSFAKNEVQSLDEEIKEEKRVEKELKEFISIVEKNSGHGFIGHEKRYGKHLIRFLFTTGGFLEVIVDKPLTMNAHFINEKHAEKYAKGLKIALEKVLPNHPVKPIFIESIKIEDGFKDDVISLDRWSKMHKITIHKTLVTTIVIFLIFIIMGITQEYIEHVTSEMFQLRSVAITIAAALNPLKRR